jgi:tetrapyrrole methylase family protein/MazG family protein
MHDTALNHGPQADHSVRALHIAGIDPGNGLQTVPGHVLAGQHHPLVEVRLPIVITDVGSAEDVAAMTETLLHAYPAEHPATLVDSKAETRIAVFPLGQVPMLDSFAGVYTLCIPPLATGSSFNDLLEIVAHLRAPDGCPWDREQTIASIRQDLLGETVEVLEAIDIDETGVDNAEHIAEELGDVMMLAAMMTQIAGEAGRFQMSDVMRHIVEKLIRRHPHVFGDQSVNGTAEVALNWEAIKAEEKASKGLHPARPLDGVPAHLPALEKARKLQSKARKAGLLDRQALAASEPGMTAWLGARPDSETIGTALWALVAVADENDINAEGALRAHAVRYRQRVQSLARTHTIRHCQTD